MSSEKWEGEIKNLFQKIGKKEGTGNDFVVAKIEEEEKEEVLSS